MAKPKTIYTCEACGSQFPRWMGRCTECEAWNTIVEEMVSTVAPLPPVAQGRAAAQPMRLSEVPASAGNRSSSGFAEFDRVLGGGLVPGSVILLGGDPGIGKSTLMLQVAARVAATGQSVLYATGEESAQQVKLRAERLGAGDPETFRLMAENDLERIIAAINDLRPNLVVIDSIQAISSSQLAAAPGSVSQIRHITNQLIPIAKQHLTTIGLIGHVTKEGSLAGPRVLEHMVDVVLYCEGERFRTYRLLRGVKNRFGATDEVGVFEMAEGGLVEVENPSALFLAEYEAESTGSAIIATLEGTRPMLVEVQALAYPATAAVPRRAATGYEYNRLVQLAAVFEKRLGLPLGKADVLVNVVGGLRIGEPAGDLGIAMAIISSLRGVPLTGRTVVMGEVGLAGEVRRVHQLEPRLREAAKLGFRRALVPAKNLPLRSPIPDLEVIGVDRIWDALRHLREQVTTEPAADRATAPHTGEPGPAVTVVQPARRPGRS
ncbi:MAG: DNA repair protein RadA [Candidatus Sericytochromatia bacterium]|nr:DNA repair protein RadA [Candidatus Sericytochromatia bacterium]